MMMGTPSDSAAAVALEKPKEKIRFLEDMTEAEAAQSAGAIPAGLQNLGNTCYMNATLQALKSIPELQQELSKYKQRHGGPGRLSRAADRDSSAAGELDIRRLDFANMDITASLRDLFAQMSQTQESFPPLMFLSALRKSFPQFAQRSRDGRGYAQQDAEEAWSQVLSQLRRSLTRTESSAEGSKAASFVDNYMAGTFESVMECDDPTVREAEEPVHSKEEFLKLNCHITNETNHLRDGLANGLVEKIDKFSSTLDRDAAYTKTSKITRLPKYLTVHFVRFDWRRDTNKKAKIMRKVSFPKELDVVEFCADALQKTLAPVRNKFREVRGLEEDAERARKRQKRAADDAARSGLPDKPAETKGKKASKSKDEDTEMEGVEFKTDAELDAERNAAILDAKRDLLKLVGDLGVHDESVNRTGLYELRGIITHQGISADSGHYTAFVKKRGRKDPTTGKVGEEDGKWWWFNDDKVTEFEADRIETLSGGGECGSGQWASS
jgi:ubiquitin carboxyl-terminal hydrolase 14